MRLGHQELIKILPRQQLLGQHRECCALRGKGWNKKHSTVDYVFDYDITRLYDYHMLIMQEMERREYKPNEKWKKFAYRGKQLGCDLNLTSTLFEESKDCYKFEFGKYIYPEHNYEYLQECLENLASKGIYLEEVM